MKELAMMLCVSVLLNYAFVIVDIWKMRKLESEIEIIKDNLKYKVDRLNNDIDFLSKNVVYRDKK